jgi:hypothetical protein
MLQALNYWTGRRRGAGPKLVGHLATDSNILARSVPLRLIAGRGGLGSHGHSKHNGRCHATNDHSALSFQRLDANVAARVANPLPCHIPMTLIGRQGGAAKYL